jgi:hypothetical protein
MPKKKAAAPVEDRRTGVRRRKPTGRNERVLQHIGIEPATAEDLDTLMWLRTQRYYRDLRNEAKAAKPLKEEMFDAAVREFVRAPRGKRQELRLPRSSDVRITFWLEVALAREVEQIARAEGVPVPRVLDAALKGYVGKRLDAAARAFRVTTEETACKIMQKMAD